MPKKPAAKKRGRGARKRPVTDFLLKLAESPKLFAEYRKDPAKLLAKSKLTAEQRDAILSRDIKRIRALVVHEWPEIEAAEVAAKVIDKMPLVILVP